MKKNVKTESVVRVFNLIKNAKYTKMADSDKIAIWKIFKAVKPVAEAFINDVSDAKQKFVPYDEFLQDLQKAQAFEVARSKKEVCVDMTEDEYQGFIGKFVKYNQLVNDAVKEYAEKEVELEFVPLTADAFDKLCLSNDWTFTQTDEVENFVCE